MKVLVNLFMYVVLLPILVVCTVALNSGRSMVFPPQKPVLCRFAEFFLEEPVWRTAMLKPAVIMTANAALAVLIAWPLAYGIRKQGGKASAVRAGLWVLPFGLPPTVFGVGLGSFWSCGGGLGQNWSGMLSLAVLFLALALVAISIGLQSIDKAHIDAAATMCTTDSIFFRTIILPQIIPYMASGFFFVLVMSLNEFIVMFFVSSSSYCIVTL